MAYNSAYKGSEIDAAVGAVKNKEKTWDDKMPAVTGTAGQMVGFDDFGNPVAQDVPATGLTEEAADGKYLKIGNNYFDGFDAVAPEDGISVSIYGGGRVSVYDDRLVLSKVNGPMVTFSIDGIAVEASRGVQMGNSPITGIKTPTADDMPANKAYVDSATSDALPKLTIVTLPASGWNSSTKSQTISVAGVDADETKQWIECTGVISNQSAFDDASIKITAFAENSLTFTASTVPTVDLKVGVKIEAVKDVTPVPNVFGVCWDYGNSSTALSRLVKSNDPNGLVTVDIASEPSPAVGAGSGSSPFDNYAPWKDMDEYNIVNNAVSYRKGASGFSRTDYDTMVYIPEYWYKIVDDAANSKRYFYVSDRATDGFEKHPGSGKYVGRYNTISGYASKSGAAPLVNITRAAARTGSRGKGDKWSQYDYASWCAVWLLYLVEFADWDSQKKIGRGYVDNNSSAINSGGTDSMVYHTGRASGTDGKTAVQYRHIENPWGNVSELIDGVNFSAGTVYVCTTQANYADDTASNYTQIGSKAKSVGYIKSIGMATSAPWAFYPTAVGGDDTTYIPDRAVDGSGWRVLMVGGSYTGSAGYVGLFSFYASSRSSDTYSSAGARLLFHP